MATTPMVPQKVRGLPLGERIKWARQRSGLSHDRLVTHVGSNRSHLIKIEKGLHTPRRELRDRIADACGVPRDLFGEDEDEEAASMNLDDLLRLRIRQIVREEARA